MGVRNSLVTYMSSAQEEEYSSIGFTSLLRLTDILDEERMERAKVCPLYQQRWLLDWLYE
jgi:hypothetical protein